MLSRTPEEVAAGVSFGDGGDDRSKDGGKTYAFTEPKCAAQRSPSTWAICTF